MFRDAALAQRLVACAFEFVEEHHGSSVVEGEIARFFADAARSATRRGPAIG